MAAGGTGAGPTPFHQGLHALFHFYNLAILLVAVLIFLYYVVVVVIETAQTGVPFGRRFSKLYAPFRLIAAVGLLVPLNYGFNGAQYITLYAAKLGSSFATNGWILFNRNLTGRNPTGAPSESLVARPRVPSVDEVMYFTSVYHACREMYDIFAPDDHRQGGRGICIRPYVIVNGAAQQFANSASTSCSGTNTNNSSGGNYAYPTAKEAFRGGRMEIVLGEHDATRHQTYAGGVKPYCGVMTVSLANDNPTFYTGSAAGGGRGGRAVSGVQAIESMYYGMIQSLLGGADASKSLGAFGERAARAHVPVSSGKHDACYRSSVLNDQSTCSRGQWRPSAGAFAEQLATQRTVNEGVVQRAYDGFRGRLDLGLTEELERRGWGGAGIWYNHIADINGTFTSAVYAAPNVKRYPLLMETVKRQRMAQNKSGDICDTFNPNLGNDRNAQFESSKDPEIAFALNQAYQYFCKPPTQEAGTPAAAGATSTTTSSTTAAGCPTYNYNTLSQGGTTRSLTANTFIDVVGLIFGINGLFDIRTASCIDSATGRPVVHPLAQLSTVGRSLVENAIQSVGLSMGASFGGGIAGLLSPSLGPALGAASNILVSVATIGLTAGFILYYILPFLPFIYFFFAVGSWVKSIFEAMVGAPLWALAHLHIDGDGLPGRAAKGGYYLIFEIFLRPIVIVFGLIGGMAVFGAMAAVLNNIFDLVVLNITGAIPSQTTGSTITAGAIETMRRGVIDQFFFTIMYAILLYMMATASFKMIDNIPAMIMRWMSPGVSTFNDNKADPTQNLTAYASIATNQFASPVLSGMSQGAGAVGSLTQQLARRVTQQ
jgi:conjugal transfer/type IV secretion protein DotA/TraY